MLLVKFGLVELNCDFDQLWNSTRKFRFAVNLKEIRHKSYMNEIINKASGYFIVPQLAGRVLPEIKTYHKHYFSIAEY